MEDIFDILSEEECLDIENDSHLIQSLEIDEDYSELINSIGSKEKPMEKNKIMVPEALAADKEYVGDIYGYIREDSGYHSILSWESNDFPEIAKGDRIGSIGRYPELCGKSAVYGERKDGKLRFYLVTDNSCTYGENGELLNATPLKTDVYTMTLNLFSRNSGLVESSSMKNKCAVIVGCGSVGSIVAIQLAKAGVGRFVLIDTDCVEIHNVCRHACNLSDIGRYKVDAVADRIQLVNPAAQIKRFYKKIQDVPTEKYSEWITSRDAVFVGCCDNHVGDAYACDYAFDFGAPFVSLLFSTRATIGELFMALPERNDICFRCAYNTKIKESIAQERRNHTYVGDDERETVSFFPGLGVDVEYGDTVMSKVILDVLNRFNRDYEIRLANQFRQLVFFSGTASKGNMDEFWGSVLKKPLTLYSAAINEECRMCEHCKRS